MQAWHVGVLSHNTLATEEVAKAICFGPNFGYFLLCKFYLKSVFGDNSPTTINKKAMDGTVIQTIYLLLVVDFWTDMFLKSTHKLLIN